MCDALEDFECSIETLDDSIEEYEKDAEAAHERREVIDSAIAKLGDDVEIAERLGVNKRSAEQAEEDAVQERDDLVLELEQLSSQLQHQMDALVSERSVLESLTEIGEDVTEGIAIIDERQRWLEECQDRLEELGNRLAVALGSYELGDKGIVSPSATERPNEMREFVSPNHEQNAMQPNELGVPVVPVGDFDLPNDAMMALATYPSLVGHEPPVVSQDHQAAMYCLCSELALWLTAKQKARGQHTLGLKIDGNNGDYSEEDLIDWYLSSYRDRLVSEGISDKDLQAFDNEFIHALGAMRSEDTGFDKANLTGSERVLSPGYGPHIKPSDQQYEWSRSSSSAEMLTSKVKPLLMTNEPLHIRPDGSTLYDTPSSMSSKLNYCQGLASPDWQGTCGLCAVQNLACLASKRLSESDIISLARVNGLCDRGLLLSPGERGGTDPEQRQKLLSLIGIDSHLDMNHDVRHIADLVESGKGVIASVDTYNFWKGAVPFDQAGGHAVTITSVERDSSGNPIRFHICDSGLHDPDYTIDAEQLSSSLRAARGLNVTDYAIR